MLKKSYAVAADFAAVAAFALLARAAHRSEEMKFTFAGWLETFAPFAAGVALAWLVTLSLIHI